MKIKTTEQTNRTYLHQTGKLGVWIPKMEPSACAGEFYQPHSGWTWRGAHLYVLPSGKIVHHQGNWSAIQGQSDSQDVTVFASAAAALAAARDGDDEYSRGPAYLSELLEKAGVTELIVTLN